MARDQSEEGLLRQLEELRQELYRLTEGGSSTPDDHERQRVQEISTRMDDLVVGVMQRRARRRRSRQD